MSNDMKTIMESWKKSIKEYTPDHKKRKEDFLAPSVQKAQDKKDSAFAQAVASAMGNKGGKVFPGTAQGREDVLDAIEGGYEKVEDFEGAMALLNMIPTVNIKKPEDIPDEVKPVIFDLISALSAYGAFRFLKHGAIKARLIQRFPYHKDTIINSFSRKAGMKFSRGSRSPFALKPKLPPLQLTMYGFLAGALRVFTDEFLMWFLGDALKEEFEKETKK
jgi:hypothetical protein